VFKGFSLQDSPFTFKTVIDNSSQPQYGEISSGTAIAAASGGEDPRPPTVMNDYDEGLQIADALGKLARHVSKRWRQQLEALRAAEEQLHEALKENQQMKTAMAAAQQHVRGLTAELARMQQRLGDVTTAKTPVEAEYQFATAKQLMTDALAQMRRDREQFAPSPSTPSAPVSLSKKPLQFSEPARDSKRVKIRRGLQVNIDGVTGELVDLSLGGAQALLTQAVRPNQLIRLTIPRAEGQVTCKGRVVWAVHEQPATSLSVFRTGVKFTEVDTGAVEKVMNDFGDRPTFVQSRNSSGVA
jgi:regulator of replication initiation timing